MYVNHLFLLLKNRFRDLLMAMMKGNIGDKAVILRNKAVILKRQNVAVREYLARLKMKRPAFCYRRKVICIFWDPIRSKMS